MARFDVFLTRDGGQHVLDCQAESLDYFDTRFMVPLVRSGSQREVNRLHPVFEIEGQPMVMATHLASAVAVQELGKKVANLAAHHIEIMDALDMLISGY